MKKIIVLVIGAALSHVAIYSQDSELQKRDDQNSSRIVFRCRSSVTASNEPLLVVDGALFNSKKMKEIDPDKIESITILKDARATALYGCRAGNGVIIVATKQSRMRDFVIKDLIENVPVGRSTLTISPKDSNERKLQFLVNDSGIVRTNKLKPGAVYRISVSSVGFETYDTIYENGYRYKSQEIFLERSNTVCPEVVVQSFSVFCRRPYCKCSGIVIKRETLEKQPSTLSGTFKVYPNPMKSNSSFNIEWKQNVHGFFLLELFNQPGQLVYSNEILINEDARFLTVHLPSILAGNYFIRMTSKESAKSFTHKILVQ
jgi:TonB-dependent SusC/RagA subfamily outer membrane receptor